MIERAGWPFIFVINLPIGFAAIVLDRSFVPESRNDDRKMDIMLRSRNKIKLVWLLPEEHISFLRVDNLISEWRIDMNRDMLKGNWEQVKGHVQKKWGELTNDEIDEIDGNRKILAGKLQERYGRARDEAEREIDEFETSY